MSYTIKLIFVAIILAIFVNCSYQATDKIFCYYASWAVYRNGNGKFTPENINPNLCTHINYAFIGMDHDGNLKIADPVNDVTDGGFKRISNLKEKNPNLKVLFSLGGANADLGVFTSVAGDPQKTRNMVDSTIAFCKQYNFDGLDVDWEYPYDKVRYVALLTALRDGLHAHGYLLTAAVNSIPGEVGGYDIPGMNQALDYIHIMTYDFHSMYAGKTAQNAPLYGGDNESDWQKENRNSDAAMKQWMKGGADPAKLTIGIPFYGHTFTLSNPGNHGIDAPASGPGNGGPYTKNTGSLGYNEICEFHSHGTVVFQQDMKVPYMYDSSLWIGYDNEESVTLKTKYAQDKNLAGVMIWSIETDDMKGFCGQTNGLLKAINKQIKS